MVAGPKDTLMQRIADRLAPLVTAYWEIRGRVFDPRSRRFFRRSR